jgi:hypothetical protein
MDRELGNQTSPPTTGPSEGSVVFTEDQVAKRCLSKIEDRQPPIVTMQNRRRSEIGTRTGQSD